MYIPVDVNRESSHTAVTALHFHPGKFLEQHFILALASSNRPGHDAKIRC